MNYTLWSLSDYFFAFIFGIGNSLIFLKGKKVFQKSSQGGAAGRERSLHVILNLTTKTTIWPRWNSSQHSHTFCIYYCSYFKKLFSFQIKYNLVVAKETSFFSYLGIAEQIK